ncbi:MAG TPA: response regulator [Opitutaceae bacterium]|nr:response regulator [Opitutaceae bacterium]
MEQWPRPNQEISLLHQGLSLRILYVDDIAELRDYVRITLSRLGHRIRCAGDGLEALAVLGEDIQAVDLIITDHQMPNMDGLEFIAEVRKLPYRGKVIVFSGNLTPEIEAGYLRLNADKLIRKPILPHTLPHAIEKLYFTDNESASPSI